MRVDLAARLSRRGPGRLAAPLLLIGALSPGCGGPVDLDFDPGELEFGRINFARAVPADGFAPTAVTITNNGDKPVDLTLTTFPFEYLCLKGFAEVPATLPSIDTEEQALLTISVCDYDAEGGRGVERSGDIVIDANGQTETLGWSFLPIVDQDDTGL